MEGVQVGAFVTLVIFVAGLIYNAGRQAERLAQAEIAIREIKDEIRHELGEMKAMLRAAVGERRNWRDDQP